MPFTTDATLEDIRRDKANAHTLRWIHNDHGHCESVPDIWLCGICTHNSWTVEQALDHWQAQSNMGCDR